jgi:hypothetical protein
MRKDTHTLIYEEGNNQEVQNDVQIENRSEDTGTLLPQHLIPPDLDPTSMFQRGQKTTSS